VLARHPERIYSWLGEASISLPEVLLAPLYRGDLPLGTLWIVSEQEGHFDSGHSRILTELAAFAGKAVHMLRTEQRLQQALEQQETLTQEMSHRVKNLFAITNSLIHFSARAASTPAEMSKLLSGRLNALADAHALVLPSFDDDGTARQGADLGKLVRTVLLPHEGAALPMQPARFEIAGLPIRLGEHATSGLALVFHELATNAVKHGALKNDAGLVQVSWQQHDSVLAIAWREHGGPLIEAAPTRNGFGSILSRRTIVDQLGGTLGHDWQQQGLHVAISVPVGNLSD
jgi:two-component sensor histidine kinase